MKVYVLFEEITYCDGGVCDVIDGIYSNLDAAERAKVERDSRINKITKREFFWIEEREVIEE